MKQMAEDIRRTPPCKRTEYLSPAALAEWIKKSPPACKSHDEQWPARHPRPAPPTAQSMKANPTFSCWLFGTFGYLGRDWAGTMHSNDSLRYCIHCKGTWHDSIVSTKPPWPQPPNNLHAIPCDLRLRHPYGSECNKNNESTSVAYFNRTTKAIRTSCTFAPMPEGRNHPELNLAQWVHDTIRLNVHPSERSHEG